MAPLVIGDGLIMNSSQQQSSAFSGRFGIARRDITPPVGVYARNWGAAEHDVAETIHRPLTLTAVTIFSAEENGNGSLVLVDFDLGWWKTPSVAERFRQRLIGELSIRPEDLILALSHTHSGPPLMETDPELPGSELLSSWFADLYASTVDAIREAQSQVFAGTLDWQPGRCSLAAKRDFPDPDPQQERILCGYQPDGDPDDTLLVGRITDSEEEICATLINYACHPTTLAWQNRAISPDYVGAMRETVEQATGAPTVFLLGVCGDLAPANQYVGDWGIADRHGRRVGHAALAALNAMEAAGTQLDYEGVVESGAPLAVWRPLPGEVSQHCSSGENSSIELPLKNWPGAAELEQQRLQCKDRALSERLLRKREIRRGLGDGDAFRLPIYAWRLGDAVLVGCCCEAYSILQQELRQRFPGHTLICMNLINGSVGYLPPAALYDCDVYPVWQTPFDRGSLELVIDAMADAIQQLLDA